MPSICSKLSNFFDHRLQLVMQSLMLIVRYKSERKMQSIPEVIHWLRAISVACSVVDYLP